MLRKLAQIIAPAALALGMTTARPAHAEGDVKVLVLKEHGIGTASAAQAYVDKLIAAVAQQNGWTSAAGKYTTSRSAAETWIKANAPSYAIMSLAAYLGLRKEHGLTVVGQAVVKSAGGRQYFIISNSATDLAGCKGKTLATDHADDPRFIETVVADGDFKLADFTMVETRRPVQTLKAVIRGEAVCALVDDAQMDSLSTVEGGGSVKTAWSSSKLPPMVVVAFKGVSNGEKTAFRTNLGQVCIGAGKEACDEAGISSLRPSTDVSYSKLVKAYD